MKIISNHFKKRAINMMNKELKRATNAINEELKQTKNKTSIIIGMLKNSDGVLERQNLITHLLEELDTLAIEANSDGCEDSLYYDEDAQHDKYIEIDAYKRGFLKALKLSEILK